MTATAEKLKNGTFKHIESELYCYKETLKEIERLRTELLESGHGREFTNEGIRGNKISDPTFRATSLLLQNRQLRNMEVVTEAIRAVVDELPAEKRHLVELRYWTKPQTRTWAGIAGKLHISERQARRWRNQIVFAIAERLGWR